MQNSTPHDLLDLAMLSKALGLSRSWLNSEAIAGRIPSLKAGKRRVFNLAAVQLALAARAGEPTPERGEP